MPRAFGGIVHGVVDHLAVDSLPENSCGTIDERLDEKLGVKFIDVVLVHDRGIKTAKAVGDLLRQVGLADVEKPRQSCACKSNEHRDRHEQKLRAAAGGFSGRLRGGAAAEDWLKKMLESVPDADQPSNHR